MKNTIVIEVTRITQKTINTKSVENEKQYTLVGKATNDLTPCKITIQQLKPFTDINPGDLFPVTWGLDDG